MFSPPSEIAEIASVAMCSGPMASFVFSDRKEQLDVLNLVKRIPILLIHYIRISPKDRLGGAQVIANLDLTRVTID